MNVEKQGLNNREYEKIKEEMHQSFNRVYDKLKNYLPIK